MRRKASRQIRNVSALVPRLPILMLPIDTIPSGSQIILAFESDEYVYKDSEPFPFVPDVADPTHTVSGITWAPPIMFVNTNKPCVPGQICQLPAWTKRISSPTGARLAPFKRPLSAA